MLAYKRCSLLRNVSRRVTMFSTNQTEKVPYQYLFEDVLSVNDSLQLSKCSFKMGHMAESSVIAKAGGTVVHVSINSQAPQETPKEDFLPLTVDYRSRAYSAGYLPKNKNRRERHNDESEILVGRFIDRAIRPLFPKGYVNEVQAIITTHAADGVHDPTVAAVNAVSYALLLSKQPWMKPIGCVRVGMVNDKLVVNPSVTDMLNSPLDLLYAGSEENVLMIENESLEVSEKTMQEALKLAHSAARDIVRAQLAKLQSEDNGSNQNLNIIHRKSNYQLNDTQKRVLKEKFFDDAVRMYHEGTASKQQRGTLEGEFKARINDYLNTDYTWKDQHTVVKAMASEYILHEAFRASILHTTNPSLSVLRPDGRHPSELRALDCQVDVLPVVHGSAYFSRGETHVLCTTTLSRRRDCRKVIPVDGSSHDEIDEFFMLHYDFPPYCTGELGSATQLNRRMIGHGNLAEKALRPMIPSFDNFPYTIRVFSECTSSNGSSSMASVCGATLSLIDAGVPLRAPVAGISVGLITESIVTESAQTIGKYLLLKDIQGSEDHHGDMDFKVAGTEAGITAIQLDVKLSGGVPLPILFEALDLAREGRIEILQKMRETLQISTQANTTSSNNNNNNNNSTIVKTALKAHAPRAALIKYDPDRYEQLVGPGGEMRKFVEEQYQVEMEILPEESEVYLFGEHAELVEEARQLVMDLAVSMKEGDLVKATVRSVMDFGLILQVNRAAEAILHISQISDDPEMKQRPLTEFFKEGQQFDVQIIMIDKTMGLLRTSRKNVTNLIDGRDPLVLQPFKSDYNKTDKSNILQLPKFPVTPPRPWNKEFFRKKIASQADIDRAMQEYSTDADKNTTNSTGSSELFHRKQMSNTNSKHENHHKYRSQSNGNHNNQSQNENRRRNHRSGDEQKWKRRESHQRDSQQSDKETII